MQEAQLAINSISTRQESLEEALRAYAIAGFHYVEFALPLVKNWIAQQHTVDDVRHLLAQHQLQAIGGFETHVECFTSLNAQRANHQIHLANAQLIHELGGGTLVVGTDGPPQASFDALHTVADVFRDLASKMEGMNVNLALEFNWSPLVKSLKSATYVCEQVDHPQVGILFDPAHYYVTSTKLEHLAPTTVRWIKHVHLNDMVDKPGEFTDCNADRVLPGQGILDLPVLISILEQCGYTGFFSIEMFNDDLWHLPVFEAASQCYQSLLPLCNS